jgi:hypothetical protein
MIEIGKLGRPETDLLADGLRKRLQDATVLGKDAAVVKEYGFDPGKTLGGFSLQLGHLRLKCRLILNHDCLRLDERGYRLVELVRLSVVLVPRPGHVDAPMRELLL